MAYQTLTIRPDDGDPIELKIEARDALIWEQTGRNNPSILDYLSNPSMVELYRLAHIAMKRQHQYPGSLGDFQESFDVLLGALDADDDDPEDETGPDPTGSGVSPDDSSSSPSRPASPRPSGRKKASGR